MTTSSKAKWAMGALLAFAAVAGIGAAKKNIALTDAALVGYAASGVALALTGATAPATAAVRVRNDRS